MSMKFIRDDIQFLRGLSVIIIFFFHFEQNIFKYFYVGVDIFFLISGYVITNSIFNYINKKNDFNLSIFFLKRLKRIYPNLLFFLIVFNLLFFSYSYVNDGIYFQIIISTLTTFFAASNFYYILNPSLEYFSETVKWLNHTWSLSVELQFYVFYGILISLFAYIKKEVRTKNFFVFTLIIFFSISLYIFIFAKGKYLSSYYFGPARFWEFFLGASLYLIKIKKLENINFNYFIILYLIFLTIINFLPYHFDHRLIILIFVLPIYFYLIFNQTIKLNLFTRFFKFYGNISYSFFLWHLPIISFIGLSSNTNIYNFIISFLITTMISYTTYKFIEIPFNQKTKYDYIFKKFLKIFTIFIIFFLILIFSKYEFIYKIRDNFYKNLIKLHPKIININNNNLNMSLNDNWVLQFDSCNNKNENFSWSTRVNCLTNGTDSTLFYILGNSYGDHFVPTVHGMNRKSTLYKARFENCHVDDTSCNEKTNEILKRFKKISENFEKVFLIISLNTTKISKKKIENILINLPSYTTVIFVHPHPTLDIFSNVKKLNKFKKEKKNYLLVLNNLKAEYKVLFFDPFIYLCQNNNCNLSEYKDFFTDETHFKLSTSQYLSLNFLNFLKNN